MAQRLRAIYQNGAFVPQSPCDFPENSEVELVVERPHVLPPLVSDPADRKRILERLVERMRSNPIPADAPRHFTREELHERR
ncbi:MAG TPA: antitoxin family protein [Pyrinomonadaceae bacterium]|jgi:predicted DNA-binding antitoxin AbrB/MazE fold protein|nr:antitoxin family protein [Pyrinomonadaceae bacterium]